MLARPADRKTTLHCSPCPHARLADSHQEVLAKYTHGMIRSIANKPKKGKSITGRVRTCAHRSGTAPEAAALDRSATVTMCLWAKMPYLLRVHSLAPPPPSGGIRQWGGGLARQAYSGECAAEDEALSRRPFSEQAASGETLVHVGAAAPSVPSVDSALSPRPFSRQAASGETLVHVGAAASSQLSHTGHAAPWNQRDTI